MNLLDKLEDLIKNLRFEMNRIHGLKKQYSQEILGIVVNSDGSTNEEVEQIQLKYGIKKKGNGVVSWNNEYKEETLNETYIQVLDNIIGNIQLLIPELKHQFAAKNQNQINKILQKKLKSLNKNINSHEGYLFFDDDYRCRKNNLLKNRFDAIWKINELYLIFPLSKRKEDRLIIASAEYPFISFDIQQWCDFELSFHLIPLFKEALIQKSESFEKEKESVHVLDLNVPILHSSIFLDNMIWVFYEVLVECNAIDEDNKPVKRRFRPICDAIFTEGGDLLFKYKLPKQDFIDYLNNKKGFNENFSKLSAGTNHEQKVKNLINNRIEILSKSLSKN